ncbi:ABC transporter substrate-binding protein [Thermodesulfobacteriota bacterium]
MKEKWYVFVTALMIAVFVFAGNIVLAAQKPTTVAELALYKGADRQQILEEGAKKEGKLVYYTTGILKGSIRPFVAFFEKRYPYIKVEIWRAESFTLTPRVREEYRSGKYFVDVIEASPNPQLIFRELGLTQPFYSPGLAYIEEGAITKAPSGGAFSVAFRLSDIGIGYNPKLITMEELPKTYQDLLAPKWKGKIPIPGTNTGLVWMATILEAYGEEFVKKVADQNFILHSISAKALLDLIIAGEYPFSPALYCPHVKNSKWNGAPVDWAHLEPVYVSITQVCLPKYAPRPHAAMLFIDSFFSKEMAEIQNATGYVSTRKGATAKTAYKKFYGARSTKQIKQWMDIWTKYFLKR